MKYARVILIAALVLALVSALLLFRYLGSVEQEAQTRDMTEIVVANLDIPPGTRIDVDMVRTEMVFEELVRPDNVRAMNEIVGKFALETILADEPISKERLLDESYGALQMNLAGNHRAVSIRAASQHSVANLIQPGDYVDIMVYLPEIRDTNRIARPNITKLILQKIEVMAIDKNVFRKEVNATEEEGAPADILVTLSIPVFELEKFFLAEQEGVLKLALRPVGDDNLYVTEGAVWEEILINDQGQIKDMFPQFEVVQPSDMVLEAEGFEYTRYVYYTIQPGDTLRSISADFYGTADNYLLLKRVNNIEDENLIISGTGLKIPVLE